LDSSRSNSELLQLIPTPTNELSVNRMLDFSRQTPFSEESEEEDEEAETKVVEEKLEGASEVLRST